MQMFSATALVPALIPNHLFPKHDLTRFNKICMKYVSGKRGLISASNSCFNTEQRTLEWLMMFVFVLLFYFYFFDFISVSFFAFL